MLTTEKAGTSLLPRPEVGALLKAIAYFQLATDAIDAQRLDIHPSFKDKDLEIWCNRLEECLQDTWALYDKCCSYLFLLQRPTDIPDHI